MITALYIDMCYPTLSTMNSRVLGFISYLSAVTVVTIRMHNGQIME